MATTKKKPTTTTKKKTTAKQAPAKKAAAAKKSTKVDYYPNRVPFYVAVLAVLILFLLAVITAL